MGRHSLLFQTSSPGRIDRQFQINFELIVRQVKSIFFFFTSSLHISNPPCLSSVLCSEPTDKLIGRPSLLLRTSSTGPISDILAINRPGSKIHFLFAYFLRANCELLRIHLPYAFRDSLLLAHKSMGNSFSAHFPAPHRQCHLRLTCN